MLSLSLHWKKQSLWFGAFLEGLGSSLPAVSVFLGEFLKVNLEAGPCPCVDLSVLLLSEGNYMLLHLFVLNDGDLLVVD